MKRILVLALIFILQFIVLEDVSASIFKKKYVSTPYQEYLYQQKVLRRIEVEKYEKSILPFSGFLTMDEYEVLSKDILNEEKVVPEFKMPKDIKMKYVPQPIYKLTRYNSPPGSPEIRMTGKFKISRTEYGDSITSPDRTMLVFPAVYYYGVSGCTAGDLFVIPLDTTLPDVERILRANVVKRNPNPILSTEKNIDQKYVFRSMTPLDFSPDSKMLLAKEKVGYVFDGIWKTNLWVYDFQTQTSRKLVEIRDAIKYYWLNAKGENLDELRWDLYPLGFDAKDTTRIIVAAYGYTGGVPKFLGTWSVDCKGEQARLVSLFNAEPEIAVGGFKLEKNGVVNPTEVYANEKREDKLIKKKRKVAKKAEKLKKKKLKQALHKKLREMKAEEREVRKIYRRHQWVIAPTALEATPVDETPLETEKVN